MSDAKNKPHVTKVNVSMLSLKWGDVLSMLLPGTVVLFALSSWFPILKERVVNLRTVGVAEGFALLTGAALLGGVLEAFTRVGWEKYWLVRKCPPGDILQSLKPENLELYERGVQSSYKYATFYANLAWGTIVLLISRVHDGKLFLFSNLIFVAVIMLLLRASHVQWTYYVNYENKVIGGNTNAQG